jgi:hypothetical protein
MGTLDIDGLSRDRTVLAFLIMTEIALSGLRPLSE